MKRIFSSSPLWLEPGVTLIRIVTGIFMIYHGWEIFDVEKMQEYGSWDIFKSSPSATAMVYAGKGAEFIAGILLTIGLLTRVAALILVFTMIYISFFVGHGKIWYEDQYPFLFVLLGLLFFFNGGGRSSVDRLIFDKLNKNI